MKNTMDAIRYGLETMDITPKELFSLIESSKGYTGNEYNRWLANEIINIAEKDGIGYSQLLAKWFNIVQSIIDEYADESVKKCFEDKIQEFLKNNKVYTIGVTQENNPYGISIDDIDWGTKVDLPYNFDFIETLPDDLQSGLKENSGVTIFVRFNPKASFKKNSDLVVDGKINGVSIKNHDALMMYRMCTIVRALDDMGSNFKFVFMTNTKFLYDKENADVIKYLLSFFKYTGFVVNSKDLYEGSFTSEEYAVCMCTLRDGSEDIQDGFLLQRCVEENGEVVSKGKCKRYSQGSNMLTSLYNRSTAKDFKNYVPCINRENKVTGAVKGIKSAYGYLCKGNTDRSALLSCYPIENTKYIAITKDNLMEIIGYYGVTQSMDNSGMFLGIDEIIDGHPDYNILVSNCVPIFLFDINSKFCDIGVVKNKKGNDVKLVNRFDVMTSDVVKTLLDKSSVYFSYEAKELMDVCKGFLDYFVETCGEDMTGRTFEEIRKEANNDSLNKTYLNALSRCKDFVSSLYRQMY